MTETNPFTTPGRAYRETGGPGPWFVAGFDGECPYGDMINEGDTIRATGDGEYEHKECWEIDNEYKQVGPDYSVGRERNWR